MSSLFDVYNYVGDSSIKDSGNVSTISDITISAEFSSVLTTANSIVASKYQGSVPHMLRESYKNINVTFKDSDGSHTVSLDEFASKVFPALGASSVTLKNPNKRLDPKYMTSVAKAVDHLKKSLDLQKRNTIVSVFSDYVSLGQLAVGNLPQTFCFYQDVNDAVTVSLYYFFLTHPEGKTDRAGKLRDFHKVLPMQIASYQKSAESVALKSLIQSVSPNEVDSWLNTADHDVYRDVRSEMKNGETASILRANLGMIEKSDLFDDDGSYIGPRDDPPYLAKPANLNGPQTSNITTSVSGAASSKSQKSINLLGITDGTPGVDQIPFLGQIDDDFWKQLDGIRPSKVTTHFPRAPNQTPEKAVMEYYKDQDLRRIHSDKKASINTIEAFYSLTASEKVQVITNCPSGAGFFQYMQRYRQFWK